MKILLVNDTGARENLGCRLTSSTLAQSLRATFPGAQVLPAPWGFASRPAPRGPARAALASGRDLLAEPALADLARTEYGEEAFAAARTADLVLFQPEGTISDGHGALRILRNLSLPLWAALHGSRPLAVTNGTFPLLHDARAEPIRLLLARATHAALRDRLSAEHWGAAFAPDTAVLWPGGPAEGAADHLLLTTAAEAGAPRDLALARAGLAFAREAGLKPLVLTKGWERLAPLRAEIEALGGRLVERATLEEADAWIGRCRLHWGGRYHVALMAATKGVSSALVRTNTHKNLWLARDFRGIGMAEDESLPDLARALLGRPHPDPELLADVVRAAALQREDMARLRDRLAAPPSSPRGAAPGLSPAFGALLAAEAREAPKRGLLRRLLGRG